MSFSFLKITLFFKDSSQSLINKLVNPKSKGGLYCGEPKWWLFLVKGVSLYDGICVWKYELISPTLDNSITSHNERPLMPPHPGAPAREVSKS